MTQNINEIAATLANGLSLDDLRRRQNGNPADKPKPAKTAEQIEAEHSYWQLVFSERQAQPEGLRFSRGTAQEMDYEEARKKFFAIIQMRAAHISMEKREPDWNWQWDDDLKRNVRNLVKWVINDPTCELNLTKGLFVFGENGAGKTEFLTALETFAKRYVLSKQFELCSMSEVYDRTREDKDYSPIKENIQFDRCFDEFGRHVGPVVRYGDGLDINEAIIEARYNRFRRYGQISHFIANMAPNEAEQAFSPVIFDRLRTMCTSVHFTGKSRRT